MAVMLLWLGPRPEISQAIYSTHFWVKAAYTFAMGSAGLLALERLARPGATASLPPAFVSAILALLFVAAASEIASVPSGDRSRLWLGSSSSVCPWFIVALAIPPLAAAFVALRQLAPTRYARAGAAAGLMASSYAACN